MYSSQSHSISITFVNILLRAASEDEEEEEEGDEDGTQKKRKKWSVGPEYDEEAALQEAIKKSTSHVGEGIKRRERKKEEKGKQEKN